MKYHSLLSVLNGDFLTETEEVLDKGQKISFSLGSFTQWFFNSLFNSWLFSFYFVAVKLNVILIMTAFVVYSIWNAINDPMIGLISDRIRTSRFGRRKIFILIGMLPLTLLATLVFTPPALFGLSAMAGSTPIFTGQIINFIYLLIIIILYDTFYTMIALPYDALFPELYTSVEERSEVNTYKQIFSSIGLIFAFLLPGLLIGDLDVLIGYFITGLISSVIVGSTLIVSARFGVKERKEFKHDHKTDFAFFEGLKYSLKNKAFLLYTGIFLAYEYLVLILASIVPLFSKHVLGVEDTLLIAVLLGLLFIIGMASMYLWKKIDVKIGSRKGLFIAIAGYLGASVPLLYVWDYLSGVIIVALMGFGWGGMMYFVYLIIADVIDEDELKTGYRREGTFFGVTNFFMRLAGVLSIVTVGIVFTGASWSEYTPIVGVDVVIGLRLLVFVFPAIALGIMALLLYFYPFTKEKVNDMKEKLEKLHQEKLDKA